MKYLFGIVEQGRNNVLFLTLGVRRHNLSTSRLLGGDPVVSEHVHLHVDQRGPLPGDPQAAALRDRADQNALPMLDGVHLDLGGHALLSAAAGLQQAAVRPRRLHLHAGLGQHGRLLGHTGHPGPRT